MPSRFQLGEEYSRQQDLHAVYGGQEQQGIITPANHPIIFLITGRSGARYGYDDGWESEGVYRYFGMGKSGNMRMEGANERVREHAENGDELHLFRDLTKGRLRYEGEMTCAGWQHRENVPGEDGLARRAIVFFLGPTESLVLAEPPATIIPSPQESGLWTMPMGDLRSKTEARSPKVQAPKEAARIVRERSRALRVYVLRRAEGVCEACGDGAPFKTKAGHLFLEAHHIRRLSDGGLDEAEWVAAICPNCHRRVHYGDDGDAYNVALAAKVREAESALT